MVDCNSPARIMGGVSDSETVTDRGALAWRGARGSVAAKVGADPVRSDSPQVTAMMMGGFTVSPFGLGVGWNQTASPWANRAMPSASPYLSISFARRTRSLGLVENVA